MDFWDSADLPTSSVLPTSSQSCTHPDVAVKFMADIASGMEYLSTKRFMRDLAARNCMECPAFQESPFFRDPPMPPTLLPRMEEGVPHNTHTPFRQVRTQEWKREIEQGGWGQLSELRSRTCWNVQKGDGACWWVAGCDKRAEETERVVTFKASSLSPSKLSVLPEILPDCGHTG